MGQGGWRPGGGGTEGAEGAEGAAVRSRDSDELQQPEGCIGGDSDTVYPQCGGRSSCAGASTGAVLVQPQLLDSGRCPCCTGHRHGCPLLGGTQAWGLAGAGGGL